MVKHSVFPSRDMRIVTTVTDPSNFSEIETVLHDQWFPVDGIRFDKDARIVNMEFAVQATGQVVQKYLFFRKIREMRRRFVLSVFNVLEVNVQDRELVGDYDFNEFRFDRNTGILRILTGVPLGLEIRVEELHLVLGTDEQIVSSKEKWRILH